MGPEDREKLEASPAGRRVLRLLRRPNELLVAILAANLVINTAFSANLEELLTDHLGHAGLPLSILLAATLLLLFGEVTPQRIAFARRRSFAVLTAPFLIVVKTAIFPFVRLYDRLTHPWTSREAAAPAERVTLAEVERGIEENAALTDDERRILLGLIRLDRVRAGEIGTPRDKINALPATATVAEALEQIRASGHSRWPVVDQGDLDRPLGFVYAKSLLDLPGAARLDANLHPLPSVFADEPLDRVFLQLRRESVHLARVTDGAGRTAGLLTMEDILARIFGGSRWRLGAPKA